MTTLVECAQKNVEFLEDGVERLPDRKETRVIMERWEKVFKNPNGTDFLKFQDHIERLRPMHSARMNWLSMKKQHNVRASVQKLCSLRYIPEEVCDKILGYHEYESLRQATLVVEKYFKRQKLIS